MAQEEEVAFDNWEDAGGEEEAAFGNWEEQAENEQSATQQQNKKDEKSEPQNEKAKVQEKKAQPVDPKQKFLNKLNEYKSINENQFEEYFDNALAASTNEKVQVNNQILKNDKDFALFGKSVARVFNEKCQDEDLDNIDDTSMVNFFEQSLLLIYNQFDWKNMEGVKGKLKIIKREKKEEVPKGKGKKKPKQGHTQDKIQQKPAEDDIFGGAVLVNSKQVEEQLKKGPPKKVQEPAKVQEDDDDDFM